MLKDEIIQRSTLRGLKKCKSCGNYNGNRARGCINKNCSLHVIKKLQKTKYNSIDPIQLITYNDTKIYSVRNKEREPLHRNFVQITDTILSSDKNGSIISRNAICYVDTCKYDSNDIKNLSCKHVKSVTTECKLYAQEIKISKNILYNMKIDNKLKINLWNLYNDNNELYMPSIQRINKTTFVIKCIKNIKFPAGHLHVTVKSDDDHDDDFYYICACKKLKILLSQNNNSTLILENDACDHLLMLLAGILSSPQHLQNQFQNLIKSLKIFWDNNNDCDFISIPSTTTLDTNDFLQNGDLYNFTEGILNSVTELDNNESLPVNLFQNNDDNSNQLLHQLISNEYDNKIIDENNEIHLLEMPSSKLIKNFYPIDIDMTTTTTENIIDGSNNNNNIIENNDNNNSNLLSISTVMETESPLSSSSTSSSSSLTLPLTVPPSLLPLSLPSPSIIDNEYLELADCQIELMDQFKLTDQIDLCNSEVLLNIDEYMEMEKNDNNINNYNSILNNNSLNLNLEHNNNQNEMKMINIDTNNCYNNDSMNDIDKTIISDNQMKYRKLNKKYNKQNYKTATAVVATVGTPVTTPATTTTTTTRILETPPVLGIPTLPATTTITKSSSINHCNKSLITQKNNINSRHQPIFEFNEWLEFVIEKINMSIDANSKNTNIKHAFSIKNEFFEYFSQKFSINGKRRIPNDTVIIKNGKFKGLIQSKWTFYSPSIIKRIFTTQTSQIEFERYFIQESNGTYKLYDEIMNPNDNVLDEKILNSKKYKKILPNLICTFIKIDLNLKEENRNAFSIEWIPDVFPKSQIGIMRIEFSIDFRNNKSL